MTPDDQLLVPSHFTHFFYTFTFSSTQSYSYIILHICKLSNTICNNYKANFTPWNGSFQKEVGVKPMLSEADPEMFQDEAGGGWWLEKDWEILEAETQR